MKNIMRFVLSIRKPGSIALKWMLSYLAILLIFIIFIVGTFLNTYSVLESEIIRSNGFVFSVLKVKFDRIFNDIESVISSMLSGRLGSLAMQTGPYLDMEAYGFKNFSQELGKFSYFAQDVENYFAFFEAYDTVVSTGGVSRSNIFYSSYFEGSELTYQQWMAIITTDSGGSLVTVDQTDGTKKYIYVSRIPFDLYFGKPFMTMVFVIDASDFYFVLDELFETSGARIIMIDSNNKIINLSRDPALDNLDIGSLYKRGKKTYIKAGRQEYVVLYTGNNAGGMSYIYAVPSNIFWAKLSNTVKINAYGITGGVLLILFLSIYFSKKHYNPLSSLLKIIRSYQNKSDTLPRDEYELINSVFANILSEQEKLSRRLEEQSESLRKNFLVRFIKGGADPDLPLYEAFSAYNIGFSEGKYAVVLILIDDIKGFMKDCDSASVESEYSLAQFILTNVLTESFCENHYCIMLEIDKTLACIVNFKNDIDDASARKEIVDIYDKARAFIAEQFEIYFSIASSRIKDCVESIPAAYNEAQAVLEYKSIMGSDAIFPEVPPDGGIGDIHSDMENECLLMKHIKKGDFESGREILGRLADGLLQRSVISPALVRWEIHSLVNSMLKLVSATGGDTTAFIVYLTEKYQTEMDNGFMEIKDTLICMLEDICDFINKNLQESSELEKKVMAYISTHYNDVSLSVAQIADYCNLHPSYLSTTFKNHAKEGILERIHKFRCMRAAEFLSVGDKSVQQISELVGYTNLRTFVRVFKKYYGVTPSLYKHQF